MINLFHINTMHIWIKCNIIGIKLIQIMYNWIIFKMVIHFLMVIHFMSAVSNIFKRYFLASHPDQVGSCGMSCWKTSLKASHTSLQNILSSGNSHSILAWLTINNIFNMSLRNDVSNDQIWLEKWFSVSFDRRADSATLFQEMMENFPVRKIAECNRN